MMKGYFKQPEKTAETLDAEGWRYTGDIGKWMANGCLRIIGRKKHIFKTQHGEYIAPERLEGQMFVYGNSLQAYLVAVIVPNPEKWAEINEDKGIMGFKLTVLNGICKNKSTRLTHNNHSLSTTQIKTLTLHVPFHNK